jgi:hypothetical protein
VDHHKAQRSVQRTERAMAAVCDELHTKPVIIRTAEAQEQTAPSYFVILFRVFDIKDFCIDKYMPSKESDSFQ